MINPPIIPFSLRGEGKEVINSIESCTIASLPVNVRVGKGKLVSQRQHAV